MTGTFEDWGGGRKDEMLLKGKATMKRPTRIVLLNWGTKEAVMEPFNYFKIANRKYTLT